MRRMGRQSDETRPGTKPGTFKRARHSTLYLTRQANFDARRRKVRLSFAKIYQLFASTDLSLREIAQRCEVSPARLRTIYDLHFSALLGMSAIARKQKREARRREHRSERIARHRERDELLLAIRRSADRAARKGFSPGHRIEPTMASKKGPLKAIRRKAILVDDHVESVHHIQNRKLSRSGRVAYGTTSLHRHVLAATQHSIFVVDVAGYLRRVLRSRNTDLLAAFFSRSTIAVGIYIPLDHRPQNSRYDFLADEDNWS